MNTDQLGIRWGFPYKATKRHAFQGGYSICGRFASHLEGSGPPAGDPADPTRTPPNTCAACWHEYRRRTRQAAE